MKPLQLLWKIPRSYSKNKQGNKLPYHANPMVISKSKASVYVSVSRTKNLNFQSRSASRAESLNFRNYIFSQNGRGYVF